MMILIELISSKRDVNGNRYHLAKIANNQGDKKLLLINSPGNLHGTLSRYYGGWEKLRENVLFSESTLPIREFKRLSKGGIYANEQETIEIIETLTFA